MNGKGVAPAGPAAGTLDGRAGKRYTNVMKTLDELKSVYDLPLPELIFRAAEVHRAHHDSTDIQRCALLSIKTGGCPEDCGYCAQSARYNDAGAGRRRC